MPMAVFVRHHIQKKHNASDVLYPAADLKPTYVDRKEGCPHLGEKVENSTSLRAECLNYDVKQ